MCVYVYTHINSQNCAPDRRYVSKIYETVDCPVMSHTQVILVPDFSARGLSTECSYKHRNWRVYNMTRVDIFSEKYYYDKIKYYQNRLFELGI